MCANRDNGQFWNAFNEKYPGMLSNENLMLLKKLRSPKVDEVWIKSFPEHHRCFGQIIERHNINYGALAYPLPKVVHRGQPGYHIFHPKLDGDK